MDGKRFLTLSLFPLGISAVTIVIIGAMHAVLSTVYYILRFSFLSALNPGELIGHPSTLHCHAVLHQLETVHAVLD